MRPPVILASGSAIRARILAAAGVDYAVLKPDVDEDAIKARCAQAGVNLEETALALAKAKAKAVDAPDDALVIGSDQILEFEGRPYDKCASMEEARARLMQLQGKEHRLINGLVVALAGEIVFRSVERPRLSMRALGPAEIDRYLAAAGEDVLSSVGAYQVEALGARLFERIDGDYFAVLGLALFPLLAFLRSEGALEF